MLKTLTSLCLLSLCVPAMADQACVLPRPGDLLGTDRPAIVQPSQLPVDQYLLAISWSPNYCAGAQGQPDASFQCELNAFTWVVHGLWPGSSKAARVADQPAYCAAPAPVSEATLRKHLCTVPGAKLMRHEWAKHGTCAFTTPESYFDKAQALRADLKLPDAAALAKARPQFTVGDLRAAFVSQNPQVPPAALMVALDKRQRLQEVRLCYDKQFRFQRCSQPGAPDRLPLRVTPPAR